MKVSDFDFELPQHLIAQVPLAKRSDSKLLVVNGMDDLIDSRFFNLANFLKKGDVLVFNDSKVLPARLIGSKEFTNARVELLILKLEDNFAKALVGNAKVVKKGTRILFGDGLLIAECVEVLDEGMRLFKLFYQGILLEILEQLGQMPLPPYIHQTLAEKDRYQTVYANTLGSAAAPTAGLHFTVELLAELKAKGIELAYLTLHVGLGTFRPVKVDDVAQHKMHFEDYYMPKESAELLNRAKKENRRIIAVGTTSTRVLETQMMKYRQFKEEVGSTDIFITPGYKFTAIDGLITNFHLPKSTLVMLVSAFSGKELIWRSYQHAIDHNYRFFSFGDAMLLWNHS